MSHVPAGRPGFLQRPSNAVLVILVGLHVLALLVVLIRADALASQDADVARANRIATSPATPYLGFPVEFLPVQTAVDRLIAGGNVADAARRIALLACIADLAAAAGMWWGWGRRQAATYLALGLPLLTFLYLRFDPVAVALAIWSYAFLVRKRPDLAGGALGLGVMAKLWPIALAPVFALRKARRGLLLAVGVCLVLGAWWYLAGGPKGPFQVLSLRDTRGWHVESIVGSVLWAFGRGEPYREADAIRIDHISLLARVLLGIGLLVMQVWIWRRAAADRRDAMGAATLAAVAALAVFTPVFSLQVAAWLLPFAALAFEGDHDERHTAGIATVAVMLTGAIALVWRDHAVTPSGWVAWLVLARNLVWIDIVVSWLRVPVPHTEPTAPAEAPRRRAADSATEGIEAVLPFEAE
jgi:Glycosyltransferase family 87